MQKYALEIFYSDEGFIGLLPGLSGCSVFGETEDMALHELMIAIDLWLQTARKVGRRIPNPGEKITQWFNQEK